MGRMRAKIALRFPMEMEAQGLGQWDPFSLPSPETDRQTGEAGHREDSERWIWNKLKGERKQTEQLKSFPGTFPLPLPSLLQSLLLTQTQA